MQMHAASATTVQNVISVLIAARDCKAQVQCILSECFNDVWSIPNSNY